MSSASPTGDDWDGNIVLSDMEEPNREDKVERMLPYQQPTQTGHMIAEFQNHWKGSPASLESRSKSGNHKNQIEHKLWLIY